MELRLFSRSQMESTITAMAVSPSTESFLHDAFGLTAIHSPRRLSFLSGDFRSEPLISGQPAALATASTSSMVNVLPDAARLMCSSADPDASRATTTAIVSGSDKKTFTERRVTRTVVGAIDRQVSAPATSMLSRRARPLTAVGNGATATASAPLKVCTHPLPSPLPMRPPLKSTESAASAGEPPHGSSPGPVPAMRRRRGRWYVPQRPHAADWVARRTRQPSGHDHQRRRESRHDQDSGRGGGTSPEPAACDISRASRRPATPAEEHQPAGGRQPAPMPPARARHRHHGRDGGAVSQAAAPHRRADHAAGPTRGCRRAPRSLT